MKEARDAILKVLEKRTLDDIKNLGVNQQQLSALDQFSKQTTEAAEPSQQNFFGGGVKEKLQGAGINTGGLMKSVLAIAAPMLMGRMLSRGRSGGIGGGGGLGGMLGGGGGLGGMLGGGGGLGSLIGMLSGGEIRSTGGSLGRMFGGRGF